MKGSIYLSLLLSFILISGCTSQVVELRGGTFTEPTLEKTHHFFVGGIGQEAMVDIGRVCEGSQRVGRIETARSFLNIFVSSLTFGIYTPRQAKIYCTH